MSVCRVLMRLPTRSEIVIELEYYSLTLRTSKLKKKYIRSKYQYCTNLRGFKTGGAILRNHR